MVADLRKMQENQGFSENRIDKSRLGMTHSQNSFVPHSFFHCNNITDALYK